MGIFSVPLEVGDPEGSRFERIEALVDTGATFSIVPASILHRLGVEPHERGSFELADGSLRDFSIGETRVRVDGKEINSPVVFGEETMEPILGAVTLEVLGRAVDPARRRLIRVPLATAVTSAPQNRFHELPRINY